ncbi:hypothetical protein ABT009_40255 [Streptomyces sp. NPDC002896]|uniref:hypothetical protein n=1 Tax=Streptomyces sp. NPDC002896 TaxID=3154438 RepID=UPI00332AAC23
MSNDPDATTIQTVYAKRVASDLESNRRQQSEIRAKLQDLQDRLEQLQQDEKWLSGVQGSLTSTPPQQAEPAVAEAPAPSSTAAPATAPRAVPQPRAERKNAGTQDRRKKTAQAGTDGQVTSPKKAVKKTAGKSAGPTLRELVLGLLVQGRGEPRMVSEVVKELAEAYPERAAKPQVVRNTLESLVAKGEIERERRQGSVMYTAPEPMDTTEAAAASDAVVEDASEKSTAKV